MESNPLLEAFGNAKTVRNDNSSRFGKYVEMQFNAAHQISGAAIRTYLLERSRVVKLTEGERNFHIFYQLCAGADEESRSEWRLKDAKYFNYLNQSSCFELNGVDNAKEYERTVQAMDVIGIDATERRNILSVLAGILHLGNVKFIDAADSDDDGCVLDGDNAKNALLDCAAVFEGGRAGNLEQWLCSRRIVLADEVIHKSCPQPPLHTRAMRSRRVCIQNCSTCSSIA